MLARRSFLILGGSFIGAAGAGLPVLAQRKDVDLEADTAQDTADVRRRFMMEDTYGNLVKDEDFQGKFMLIYFGYMSCPDVCPTTLATLADAMEQLGDLNEDLAVLFVTVDPDRDSAKDLHDYVQFFDKRIIALRGPKAYTDHMVKAYNAKYQFYYPDPEDKSEYSVDHTASVAFVGPYGNLIKRFPHGMSADDIAKDIRETMEAARK
ncbi:SCO family protein [Profundibacter sp.]